jgi:hypothetical protein
MANRLKQIAAELLQRYQQRKARGELRVDDKLYLDLCQMMPEKAAQEPQPITGTTLKELAQAKVLAGQPLNDAEEDASCGRESRFEPIARGVGRPAAREPFCCLGPASTVRPSS